MSGLGQLLGFVAVLIGLPVLLSILVGFVLRSYVPHWSRAKRAWTCAVVGPFIEGALAILFVLSTAMADCPPESVCDMSGLAVGVGLMLFLAAAVTYPISAVVTYGLVRDGSREI